MLQNGRHGIEFVELRTVGGLSKTRLQASGKLVNAVNSEAVVIDACAAEAVDACNMLQCGKGGINDGFVIFAEIGLVDGGDVMTACLQLAFDKKARIDFRTDLKAEHVGRAARYDYRITAVGS